MLNTYCRGMLNAGEKVIIWGCVCAGIEEISGIGLDHSVMYRTVNGQKHPKTLYISHVIYTA